MTALPLLKPQHYRREGTETMPASPALLGGRCTRCGYVFFPRKSYGCEKCGGTDLADVALAGHGTLLASAEVHIHAGKGREAPFVIGTIALDDGPVVRTLLKSRMTLPIGTKLHTLLVDIADRDGQPASDLRFAPEA